MDNRTILQINPRTKRLLVLEMIDTEKQVFKPRELKNYPDKLVFVLEFSMSRTSYKHAYFTGGWKGKILKSCMRFDLESEAWDQMPNMKVARRSHSSCFLAGFLYVFCGEGESKRDSYNGTNYLCSIEKLRILD